MSEQIRILEASLEEVDEAPWDSLVGQCVESRISWLHVKRKSLAHPSSLRFLLAYSGCDLLGGLYYWEQVNEENGAHLDLVIWGRLRRPACGLGLSLNRVWLCCQIGSVGQAVFGPPGVQIDLLRWLRQKARSCGATLCIRGMGPDFHRLAGGLGFLSNPEFPNCLMPVRYRDFGHYLSELRQSHRSTARTIQNEMNRARKSGLQIGEMTEPWRHSETIAGLLNQHALRLNGRPSPFGPELFDSTKRDLKGRLRVLDAHLNGRLVGVLLLTHDGERMRAMSVGIDPEVPKKAAVYPNLTFTEPTRLAIAEGVKEVDFGSLVYQMKLRRGCELMERRLYLAPKNLLHQVALKCFFFIRERQMRRKIASMVSS